MISDLQLDNVTCLLYKIDAAKYKVKCPLLNLEADNA